MRKKILFCILIIIFICFGIYVISNRPMANQIIISSQDIYDSLFNNEQYISDPREISINTLNQVNSTFYYDMLTENQKKVYIDIANAIKNLDSKVKLKDYNYIDDNTTMADVKVAVQNLLLDHPEIFYVNNDYTISTIELLNSRRIEVDLSYSLSNNEELTKKINQINEVLNPIVENAKSMDKFNAELYIHDKICEICSYYKYNNINEVPEECHNIFGCMVKKEAVCDGLSKTFQLILNKVGIDNIVVTGYLQNQPHAWNMVKLNEKWYHVDITSDKSVKDEKDKEEIIHSYFNITTDIIKKTNTIDLNDKIPLADDTENNYYIKTNKYINITDNFNTKFKNILDSNTNDKLLEFLVDSRVKSVPEKIVYEFENQKYQKYFDKGTNKFNYYNILNTYIILTEQ